MSTTKLFFIKILLTILVSIALTLPLIFPSLGNGILDEMRRYGLTVSLVVVFVFLTLVFFYCKDLQRTLELIEPQFRAAKPKSVWLMFLIPYNFIEDFFIVYNVSKSLSNKAKQNISFRKSQSFGLISGLGWCSAQIVSLFPGVLGQFAGLVALVFWIVHWRFIRTFLRTPSGEELN